MKKKKSKKISEVRRGFSEFASAFKPRVEPRHRVDRTNPADVWARLEGAKVSISRNKVSTIEMMRKRLLAKKNHGEALATKYLKEAKAQYTRETVVHGHEKLIFIDFFVSAIHVGSATRSVKVALEIDGSSHNTESVKAKDVRKDACLLATPWINGVLRITTPRLRKMSAIELRDALLSVPAGQVTRLS